MNGSRALGLASISLLLGACGGGGSGSGSPAPPPAPASRAYTISGVVNGLSGTVVLAVSGGSDVSVTAAGNTALTTTLANGANYTVSVKTQPTAPTQICSVTAGGSGTVTASSATAISGLVVDCVTQGLSLASSTPADNASGQSCGVAPKLVFNHPVDPATAIASNFTLESLGTPAPFTVAVSGAEVTLTLTGRLYKIVPYVLTASTNVRGTNGEALGAAASITFACDGAFNGAAAFPKDAGDDAGNGSVLMDANGNGFAVWNQKDNGLYSVYARRYTRAGGWAAPQAVESQTTNAYTPTIGFDVQGNATIAFLVSDGSQNQVWANRWTNSGGWGTEERIDNMPDDAENPQIAVNGSGEAIVAWYQGDAADNYFFGVVSNRYTPGSGWGTAQVLDTISTANAFNPRPAIDPDGNALVVWQQRGGAWGNDICSRRYVAGSGWAAPVAVETDDAGTASSVRIKLDTNGNGIAVWYQSDGTRTNVYANRFEATTGWATPTLLETDNAGDATLPRIDMNENGAALVAWYQSDGTRTNLWATSFVPQTGWATATRIESDDAGDAMFPWCAIDAAGNGLVTWQQSNGMSDHIWASRFTSRGGFGARQRVDSDDATSSDSPWVAADREGNALIVWESFDGALYTVWGAKFD